jgi:hypothetical protein
VPFVGAAGVGTATIRASADKFAVNVRPIIESLRAAGIAALAGIAEAPECCSMQASLALLRCVGDAA